MDATPSEVTFSMLKSPTMSLYSRVLQHPIFTDMTLTMAFAATIASMGAMSAGYDGGWWSTFMSNQNSLKDYGRYNPLTQTYYMPSSWQSTGTGVANAGSMVGALGLSFVGEKYGRRASIFVSAIISIAGVIIQCAASGYFWVMTVGRIINAIGVGVAYSIVPIYLAECSPPTVRGTLTSFYQWFFTFGQFWAYFIIYFTKDKTTKWSYLTAILVQVVIPAFMLAATPFLIESPRWLIITGKREQGVISMSKLYGKDTQYDINKIADEIEEAHNALQNYRKDTSYLDLFKGVNLRRTLIAMAIPCLLTGQGLVFMGAYLVLFLESIGVDDANLMLMVIMLVLLATNTFSFWGADRFGRRNLLMISSFFMAISFYLVAVFAWYVRSNAANNTVVAFLFIWCIVYGATWAPLAHITVGEIPSTQLREKTLAVAMFLNFGISMLVSFVNPYIQNAGEGNLQGRVGFVYGSVSWLAIIMVYFGLPEVKGLSLDVIDTLFELKTSAKTFLKEGQKLMAADGVVELDHVLSAHKSIVEGERVLESMFSPKEKMYEE